MSSLKDLSLADLALIGFKWRTCCTVVDIFESLLSKETCRNVQVMGGGIVDAMPRGELISFLSRSTAQQIESTIIMEEFPPDECANNLAGEDIDCENFLLAIKKCVRDPEIYDNYIEIFHAHYAERRRIILEILKK